MSNSPHHVGVLIPVGLYSEFILRTGKAGVAEAMIEYAISEFLDRTRDDPGMWSRDFEVKVENEKTDEWLQRYGDPQKGYQWSLLFLPNGTKLKMSYRRKDHFAEVRRESIVYLGKNVTPSEFCSRVADNTSRNAWRDIWIKRPLDEDWIFSDSLRRNVPGAVSSR